jgi:hypothetical protein
MMISKSMNTWTVKLLKLALKDFPDEAIVVMAADAEGNDLDTLFTIEEMNYDAKRKEALYRELTPKMREQGYTEEDISTDGQLAIVLWP